MFNFEKILDFSYSDDGLKLVMSAYNKGYSDIYIHNLAAHTNKQITNDFADDLNPRFINNSEDIIFSSNRNKSQINSKLGIDIELNTSHDIFIYNVKSNNKELTRLTKTPYIDETNPFSIKENIYSFLSNQNGIKNRYTAYIDSAINYIDTITHYRYYTVSYPSTNYSRNILQQDFNKKGDYI